MGGDGCDGPGGDPSLNRRRLLGAVAGGAVAGVAGCSLFERGEDAEVSGLDDDRALELAEQFAPTLYFDRNERWFPTDPRPYESEKDGETVVNGFDAFEGYVGDGGAADPPAPTTFYHAVAYENSPLAVVQFWFYSAFDQFTTNFHWHDWELLQVFVDTATDEPQLYVASSHSRSVPNNEHLDPDPDRQPRILSELGSHSSGLSVNDDETGFQRLPLGDTIADVTNSVVDGVEDIASIPLAYGLPRDEGFALPFAVPELDGEPVYEHDRLPTVGQADLVPEALTVGSFQELGSPPSDLPRRETGRRFEYEGRADAAADVAYELVPTAELEHIADFTGPQLSFEFPIPEFAEDAVASHITTTGVPWKDPRYDEPARDITETDHRQALANRYDAIGEPAPAKQVLASVTNAVTSDDAPENEGLETVAPSLEAFALLQSDPEAVPTFRGLAVFQGVPEGEHRLSITGAGVAPHSERVRVSQGTNLAGVDGEIPLVARERAVKLAVDPREADSELRTLAVEDDFAGRLYDAPLGGPDAVYVHRGGAYTTEVRDTDDEVGAFRVNPGQEDVRLEDIRTGKTPLATYLADVAAETRDEVAEILDGDPGDGDDNRRAGQNDNAVRGLAEALSAIADAAERAAERAESGDAPGADRQLEAVRSRLERATTRLSEARGALPEGLANAADNRFEQADRRADQALDADKL